MRRGQVGVAAILAGALLGACALTVSQLTQSRNVVASPQHNEQATESYVVALAADWADASIACDRYGESHYPFGFSAHWLTGKIAEEHSSDKWWFKVSSSITNSFGATRDAIVECTVTSSGDSLQVDSFYAY